MPALSMSAMGGKTDTQHPRSRVCSWRRELQWRQSVASTRTRNRGERPPKGNKRQPCKNVPPKRSINLSEICLVLSIDCRKPTYKWQYNKRQQELWIKGN